MASLKWNRRQVLGAGAAALAAPYFIPARVLGLEDATPPSETVRVGVIGCGGRAGLITEAADVKGFRVVAACDCIRERAEKYVQELSAGQPWGVYDDVRKMIEQEKLDAVMVETTTHARAWTTILAMQMGMDVYIEKPMCLTIAEGRVMVNAAQKYQRVTQVGTQQRSMPINNWASDLVKNGTLGQIKTVLAPNFVGPFRWTKTSSADVKGPVESWWDVWTNQAELRPWDAELQMGWAKWWDYDGGGLCFGVTGWGTHSYDQINRALGTDDTGPVAVLLEEPVADRETGRFQGRETVGGVVVGLTGAEDTGVDYHGMAQLTGPRARSACGSTAAPNCGCIWTGIEVPVWEPSSWVRKASWRSTATRSPATRRKSSSRPTIPAPTRARKPPITSRTGSSASRRASAAMRISRSGYERPRCATWSTSCVMSAWSASDSSGIRSRKSSPTATMPTSCSIDLGAGYELPDLS